MGKNPSTSRSDAARQVLEDEKKRRRRSLAIQAGVVGVIVVAIVGGTIFALQSSDSGTTASAPAAVNADGALVVGDPEAPVRLQVVEDFQCPACQAFEASYGETLDEFAAGSVVAVEYRGIAFLDRASTTEYSSRALNASACVMEAADTDVWKEFHRQMFLQQPAEGGAGLPDSELIRIADDAGAGDIETCVDDRKYDDWVEATTLASGDDGINSTPTVLVDGEILEDPSPATIQAAIDEALAAS